ncbi:MAG TPA: rhodanese-like domain-containing protein [Terriglobia bacterium]|nr:rhodanese-like domain-containing protein [Terriglobia bacterium]
MTTSTGRSVRESGRTKRAGALCLFMALAASLARPGLIRPQKPQKNAPEPWTRAEVVKPAELAAQVAGGKAAKPLVICVGFHNLYSTAHIPGALFAGPARQADGLAALRQALEKLPKSKEIVVYCGCCPFAECPNVRPAFDALHRMGFTRLKVLDLENNFAQDWVNKGYPIEKGK